MTSNAAVTGKLKCWLALVKQRQTMHNENLVFSLVFNLNEIIFNLLVDLFIVQSLIDETLSKIFCFNMSAV